MARHEVHHDHEGHHGHAVHHHGEGDVHLHKRKGGEAEEERKEHEHRARGGGAEVHEREEMDHPDDKHGGHVRRHRRARGGKSEPAIHEYNAVGSPEMKEVEDKEEDFKRGGRKHKKHGGEAHGEHMRARADKTPRGRREHHRRAAGGSVYSTGSKISMHDKDGDARGHEGVHVPSEPGPG